MSAPLNLSHNELSSLLKLVFQGMFGHSQDWGALATYVLWLETHGFKGVSLLVQAIESNSLRPFDGVITKTDKCLQVDFEGISILMGLPMLADLAIAQSTRQETIRIEIISMLQGEALVATDAVLRDNGLDMFVDLQTMVISTVTDPAKTSFDFDRANQYYAQSLRGGVPMHQSTYTFLNAIADKTLVEATEASRSGAGE